MTDPNFTILYVDDPLRSAAFYGQLLGHPPIEAAPTFAMFALSSGSMLGLWSRHTVQPAPAADAGAGATELAFSVADREAVGQLHAAWRSRGLTVIQAPVDLDFGHTFVALDPDGHRLRVFVPT